MGVMRETFTKIYFSQKFHDLNKKSQYHDLNKKFLTSA